MIEQDLSQESLASNQSASSQEEVEVENKCARGGSYAQ